MKTLYLIRHAKSSWDYPELTDFERPLNKRGKRDAPIMGQRLKKRSVLPDLMLSSPANRALTTCQIIANEIGYPSTGILTRNEIYHAGSQTLLSIVQSLKDKNQSVMIFGHNPGFTHLANELTSMNLNNIPTCGVFACEFASETWQTIQYGQGKLLFYDYPKNMAL